MTPQPTKRASLPSVERLRELFTCDPEAGLLYRRCTRGNVKAGSLVGWLTDKGYLGVEVDRRKLCVHRVVWVMTHGEWPSGSLDHKNGVRADNRISNLRIATAAENTRAGRNGQKFRSKYGRGVTRERTGRFRAKVQHEGRDVHIGMFATPEEALAARVEWEQANWGEFQPISSLLPPKPEGGE